MSVSTTDDIYTVNIEKETIENNFYRKVLFTSRNLQLVVQSVKPKKDIPYEIHENVDQFIRVEKGMGKLLTGPNKEHQTDLSDGIAVIVPAETWHQIINTSDTENLKLYTIYSPPEHPKGQVEIDNPKQCGGKSHSFRNFKHPSKPTSNTKTAYDRKKFMY